MHLPVAETWFRSEEMGDGITRFREPFVDPVLESNVWLVRGRDADLVIDAGNGISPLMPFIQPLAEGRPLIAVATHGHFDHTGGLYEFTDRRCHPDDAQDVCTPFPLRLLREHFAEGTEGIFKYYGFPVPRIAISAVPSADFDLAAWSTPGAEPTGMLSEGSVIELGDRAFEVLHVPGHTAGSIALWEAGTATLFTGDAAYVDDRLSWDDEVGFRTSLTRLAAMPAARICGGHGRIFDNEELQNLAANAFAD